MREGDFGISNKIIRFGDMNKDGHQDMMLTAKHKKSKKVHTLLLKNNPCSRSFYKELGKFNGYFKRGDCRVFELDPYSSKMEDVSKVHSYTASFFDFGEYG
jgi:hypothetical protein